MSGELIWLVTSGEYSDYTVHDAYTTLGLAKLAAHRMGGERAKVWVEEKILYWDIPQKVPQGLWRVPLERRSGQPTVIAGYEWGHSDADEGVTEWVRGWHGQGREFAYQGPAAAAHACARAMAYALHGEVVEQGDVDRARLSV
jgi:hypothetical protein